MLSFFDPCLSISDGPTSKRFWHMPYSLFRYVFKAKVYVSARCVGISFECYISANRVQICLSSGPIFAGFIKTEGSAVQN